MSLKPKIKITDDNILREIIYEINKEASQNVLAQWSIVLVKHILKIAEIDYLSIDEINHGFKINEMWQIKGAKTHDVRVASFKVHALARKTENNKKKAALRAAGQAIGTAHMKEHAIISSDYAIKTINLIFPADMEAITKEKSWQLNELQKINNKLTRKEKDYEF